MRNIWLIIKDSDKLRGRKRGQSSDNSSDDCFLQSTPKRRIQSLKLSDTWKRIHSILLDITQPEWASDLDVSGPSTKDRVLRCLKKIEWIWGKSFC